MLDAPAHRMSETPKLLTRSVGIPFWIGCVVTPVLLVVLSSALGSLDDSFSFWLLVCVVPPIFGPVGGLFFQAIHDLFVARRERLIHARDIVLIALICIICLIAGYISLHIAGKDRVAEIAGAVITVLIFIYAKRR
jgi:hypothetical protein